MKPETQTIIIHSMDFILRNMTHLRVLRNAIVLETLLTVCKKPGLFLTETTRIVGGSKNAVMSAIEHLIKIGLIKEEREKEFPRRRLLFPTEKGKRIGELLEKIDEILSE